MQKSKSRRTEINRKTEIIQATLELAAEKGLGAVSMQQIANRVGITKASLYNHFSTSDLPLSQILLGAVGSYRSMVQDRKMYLFYKLIMSERTINPVAAEIMVKETETMIHATKTLFYALQVKGIARFPDADAAAFSFAMAVHAILDYEFDLQFSGRDSDENRMNDFIKEFSRLYQAREV